MSRSTAFQPTSGDIRASADQMLQWMELAQRLHPALTPHHLRVLLTVACDPGHGPTYYARKLKLHQPEVTRVLSALGHGSRRSRESRSGLRLIDYDLNPENTSRHRYFLTEDGTRLVRELADAMQGAGAAAPQRPPAPVRETALAQDNRPGCGRAEDERAAERRPMAKVEARGGLEPP